jgi:hypothetical protein
MQRPRRSPADFKLSSWLSHAESCCDHGLRVGKEVLNFQKSQRICDDFYDIAEALRGITLKSI